MSLQTLIPRQKNPENSYLTDEPSEWTSHLKSSLCLVFLSVTEAEKGSNEWKHQCWKCGRNPLCSSGFS